MKVSIELGGCGFEIADIVPVCRWAATEIDGRIPVTAMGDLNTRRQHLEMAAMIVVRPVVLETLKVCVAHHSNVTLMRALNDDDVACIEVFTSVNKSHVDS